MNPGDRYKSVQIVYKELHSLLPPSGHDHYYVKAIAQSPISKYFPPGYRSGRPLNMIVATLVYSLIILLCVSSSQFGYAPFIEITMGIALFLV